MNTSFISPFAAVAAIALVLAGCAAGATPMQQHPRISPAEIADMRAAISQYDRQIAALQVTLHGRSFDSMSATIDASVAELRDDVAQSANDIDMLVAKKADMYAAQEDDAVSAILANSGGTAPSRTQVRQRLETAYRLEYARLRSGANRDMDQYRDTLLAQQRTALETFVRFVQNRTQQAYLNRVQEMREAESALLLDLVRQDSGERLQLNAKLQTLALDPGQKKLIDARLDQLQDRENREVAALRGRNDRVLRLYQAQLLARADQDISEVSAQLQARTQANLAARRDIAAAQVASASLPLNNGAKTSPAPTADLRAQVAALRTAGANAVRTSSSAAIAAYSRAREGITQRFAVVRDTDDAARRGTLAAIAQLRAARAKLQVRLNGS
jgi:hypothetical protein